MRSAGALALALALVLLLAIECTAGFKIPIESDIVVDAVGSGSQTSINEAFVDLIEPVTVLNETLLDVAWPGTGTVFLLFSSSVCYADLNLVSWLCASPPFEFEPVRLTSMVAYANPSTSSVELLVFGKAGSDIFLAFIFDTQNEFIAVAHAPELATCTSFAVLQDELGLFCFGPYSIVLANLTSLALNATLLVPYIYAAVPVPFSASVMLFSRSTQQGGGDAILLYSLAQPKRNPALVFTLFYTIVDNTIAHLGPSSGVIAYFARLLDDQLDKQKQPADDRNAVSPSPDVLLQTMDLYTFAFAGPAYNFSAATVLATSGASTCLESECTGEFFALVHEDALATIQRVRFSNGGTLVHRQLLPCRASFVGVSSRGAYAQCNLTQDAFAIYLLGSKQVPIIPNPPPPPAADSPPSPPSPMAVIASPPPPTKPQPSPSPSSSGALSGALPAPHTPHEQIDLNAPVIVLSVFVGLCCLFALIAPLVFLMRRSDWYQRRERERRAARLNAARVSREAYLTAPARRATAKRRLGPSAMLITSSMENSSGHESLLYRDPSMILADEQADSIGIVASSVPVKVGVDRVGDGETAQASRSYAEQQKRYAWR